MGVSLSGVVCESTVPVFPWNEKGPKQEEIYEIHSADYLVRASGQ